MTHLMRVDSLCYQQFVRLNWWRKTEGFTLHPTSFDLSAGETLSVIGESGSGKSLLGKLLVGATKPKSGQVSLNGNTFKSDDINERCLKVRMIFQHSNESLNPGITIGAILEEPLKLNTQMNEQRRLHKIDITLSMVGLLPEHKYFYRHMLSEGQRQRVTLARALILNPEVIVADEPFAALDPSVRSQTINLLLKLQTELGLGFVFISHNLGIVRHISDRILVMQRGKVVETGTTDEIFNNPQHPYTQKLVTAYQDLVND